MSAKLMSAVYDSALNRSEKGALAAIAYYADDDGTKVFPSIGLLAWRMSCSERQVRRYIRAFEERGILVRESPGSGGRGMATRYRFDAQCLPERPPYKKLNPDSIVSGFSDEGDAVNPDSSDRKADIAMSGNDKPGHLEKADIGDTKGGHFEQNPDMGVHKGGHSYVRRIVMNSHLEQSEEQSLSARARTRETEQKRSKQKARRKKVYSEVYEGFSREFPKGRGSKSDGYEVWKSLGLDDDDELRAEVLAGLAECKQSEQWQTPKYIPHVDRFLRKGLYANPPPRPAPRIKHNGSTDPLSGDNSVDNTLRRYREMLGQREPAEPDDVIDVEPGGVT